MQTFWEWIIAVENRNSNVFTLITVLLSGIVSWIVSAIYFRKGNRTNLKMSVIHPMKRVLGKNYSWDNFNELERITKEYSAKYLRHYERKIINELISTYKEVCYYNYEAVCAKILFNHFKDKLSEQEIEIKIYPIEIYGEIVDMDIPAEVFQMEDDLLRAVCNYNPEFEEDECARKVMRIYASYCKEFYTDKKINFFEGTSLYGVLNESKITETWNDKFNQVKISKENFYGMRVTK